MLIYLLKVTIIISVISTQSKQSKPYRTERIARQNQGNRQNKLTFRKDYTYIKGGKSFYKYHSTQKSWLDAKEVCAQEGASLIVPENKQEVDAAISFWQLKNNQSSPSTWDSVNWVYVGITDAHSNRVFTTIDGRSINDVYHVWAEGQPDNDYGKADCVKMNKKGKYNDVPCNYPGYFICEKRIKRTTNKIPTTLKSFMFWPNASVPFYMNPDHFDHEQATILLKSLDKIEFETCIQFLPLMVAPGKGQHVMTFINPKGVRRCTIDTKGHSNYLPHLIQLGYDCFDSRELDMIIMRALGLPFEHNRANRDVYIDVWIENIEPSFIQLFTKDNILPTELQNIPYDHYSIMHFGERDYSKNGHRTIRFKNPSLFQARNGLSPAFIKRIGITPDDYKKIALIYAPECRTRDRAEQINLCRTYPGVIRQKRENKQWATKSIGG